jgi:hypothetical protein
MEIKASNIKVDIWIYVHTHWNIFEAYLKPIEVPSLCNIKDNILSMNK